MLTGRDTVAATFAATAHLHRPAPAAEEARPGGALLTTVWGALVTEVRRAALGLAAEGGGPGLEVALDVTAPLPERAVTVLVASAVGAVVATDDRGTPVGETLDLVRLGVAGAGIDDRHPDRYERLVGERTAGDPLLRNGAVVHPHATLLVAARSLGRAAGIGADDRVLVDLRAGSAAEVVAGLLLPCLTGARRWSAAAGVDRTALPEGHAPTFVAATCAADLDGIGAGDGATPRGRGRLRRSAAPALRRAIVVGDGSRPTTAGVDGATALAVEAAGGIVTGFGRTGTLGRPLPGASIAVDDDGTVLVRAGSVAPGAAGLRDDGWLDTGLTGDLHDGELVLGGGAPGPGAA